ncbi:hypothetical protein EYF80_036505 [Liparis tanakae]|uniref:Uncharacterized protein n=1 Tax=Liparis tanakae TaxID=230148 RepID=A0A4Z2GJ93_9TELE|nr:hypothetical protein EYF80_036505 [Liparis tanakae]
MKFTSAYNGMRANTSAPGLPPAPLPSCPHLCSPCAFAKAADVLHVWCETTYGIGKAPGSRERAEGEEG